MRPRLEELDCEVCILAGGQSTRMGMDKARLRLGGRSLIGHVRSTVGCLSLPTRTVRRDLVPRCGPLGGVLTALMTSRFQRILFVSCDMPFISETLITGVLSSLTGTSGSVFVRDQKGVGFPFLIPCSAISCVERQIADGRLSLKNLALKLRSKTILVPGDERFQLVNINTRKDLKIAREILKSHRGVNRPS